MEPSHDFPNTRMSNHRPTDTEPLSKHFATFAPCKDVLYFLNYVLMDLVGTTLTPTDPRA